MNALEPIDIRTGRPFEGRRAHLYRPSIDCESIAGGWGRARGLVGGAFMGAMLAQQGGGPAPVPYHGYVADGLVAYWDGIDNTGGGDEAHDPNATVWKDLVGDIDLTVNDNKAKDGMRRYRWTQNSLHNYYGGGSQPASGAYAYGGDIASFPRFCTFEYVFDVNGAFSTGAGWVALYNGNEWVEIQPDLNRGLVAFAYGKPSLAASSSDFLDAHTFCVQYGSAGSLNINSIYLDGIKCTLGSTGWPAKHTLSNAVMLGYSQNKNSGYGCPIGDCYACRVYSRTLSATDVAANYAVDAARFGIA